MRRLIACWLALCATLALCAAFALFGGGVDVPHFKVAQSAQTQLFIDDKPSDAGSLPTWTGQGPVANAECGFITTSSVGGRKFTSRFLVVVAGAYNQGDRTATLTLTAGGTSLTTAANARDYLAACCSGALPCLDPSRRSISRHGGNRASGASNAWAPNLADRISAMWWTGYPMEFL